MTNQPERERAAGYVYASEAATDTQALLFGRCGIRPSDIFYRVMLSDGAAASRQVGLRMQGDFAPWIDNALIRQIGQTPVSLQGQVNGQPVTVRFDPDPATPGNALFRTGTGLQGVVIKTHSSTWELVAIAAILVLGGVTLAAISEDTSLTVEATVNTPVGDANVNINVNGRPPNGGGEGG